MYTPGINILIVNSDCDLGLDLKSMDLDLNSVDMKV